MKLQDEVQRIFNTGQDIRQEPLFGCNDNSPIDMTSMMLPVNTRW